jgi:hypothetical protein
MALHRHVAHADEQLRADPLVPDLPRLRMPEHTTSPRSPSGSFAATSSSTATPGSIWRPS